MTALLQLKKGDQRSYEQITSTHNDVWNVSATFGHAVVVMFPATGHPANIHYHAFFRARADEQYTCITPYAKNKGRAIKILCNHYRKTYKQALK